MNLELVHYLTGIIGALLTIIAIFIAYVKGIIKMGKNKGIRQQRINNIQDEVEDVTKEVDQLCQEDFVRKETFDSFRAEMYDLKTTVHRIKDDVSTLDDKADTNAECITEIKKVLNENTKKLGKVNERTKIMLKEWREGGP